MQLPLRQWPSTQCTWCLAIRSQHTGIFGHITLSGAGDGAISTTVGTTTDIVVKADLDLALGLFLNLFLNLSLQDHT
jgi:hypothetical protein